MRQSNLRILGSIFALCASAVARQHPVPDDAVQGIVKAFDQHAVVAIAEYHQVQQAGDFYNSLVRDPAFQGKVNDIVIEFASRRSQPIIDRYVSGEDVSILNLQHAWRDSTKVMSWESPIYANFLAAVREVNKNLPAARRLRVLAGDSPIEWDKIKTNADWGAFQPNDNSFFWVIVHEVLQKHRRALVILGSNHLTKDGDADGFDDTSTLVEKQFPNSMYVALMYTERLSGVQEQLSEWPVPSLVPIHGTRLGAVSFGGRSLEKAADALLYLGSGSSLRIAQPDFDVLRGDDAYMKEVARRFEIVYGCKFDPSLLGKGRPCQ
ncbi:MAG TPA: hypothetical protein VKB47_12020 [Terracidiphilus sp.]|nr:hypothetical protein [Terracidiphilus sp.]